MNKKDVIVLAKKSKKREGAYYSTLYLDKTAIYGKEPFAVCEKFSIENNQIYISEDIKYYSLSTALISFYFQELQAFGIDKNILMILYKKMCNKYERFNEIELNSQLTDKEIQLLENNKTEIELIQRLINKWYSEDIK